MLTINALTAANSVIIPSQPEYLSANGTYELLKRIQKVKEDCNSDLHVEGILITMTDDRTVLSNTVRKQIQEQYGKQYHVFSYSVPRRVAIAESSAMGKSILSFPLAASRCGKDKPVPDRAVVGAESCGRWG